IVSSKTRSDKETELWNQFTNGKNFRFYEQYTHVAQAGIEDLFEPNEIALALMSAYGTKVAESFRPVEGEGLLTQLQIALGRESFDRLRIARELALLPDIKNNISEKTFNRFEKLFRDINKLM
ncbi:MAG: hypothetical protein Q8908_03845, partial [Bacteroidota bacterium]|nr:hypothetical protein [Bacteroidota bacterium]